MAAAFDTLRYTQRLEEVGVSHDQAVRHAELARDMILQDLVTQDRFEERLKLLRAEFNTDIANAKADIVRTIVIAQLATILVVVVGLIFK
jgi:hypothetical protein